MSARWLPERVLVYRHPVDMRKQIDGLSELVAAELDQEQLDYLLDGYDLNGMRPHREQVYARHF